MNSADIAPAIARLSNVLRAASIPFHLTGGIVASYYGQPRMTLDIDVVVRLKDTADTARLVDALKPFFYVDEQAVLISIRSNHMFQALNNETLLKIDFHVGERIPGELERSVTTELFPGIHVPIASPEDAVISKLLWNAMGSERSWNDALHIVRRQTGLDRSLLAALADTLKVSEQLERLMAEAGAD